MNQALRVDAATVDVSIAKHVEEEETEQATDSDNSSDDDGSEYDDDSSDDDDDDEEDSDDSSWGSEMDELEAAIVTNNHNPNVFGRSMSSPAMQAIMTMQPAGTAKPSPLPGLLDLRDRMKKSESNAYLQPAVAPKVEETVEDPYAATKPDDFLLSILEGISASSFPSETWHDYFITMTPEHVESYTTEIVNAIRRDEYDVLREHLRNGQTLQCCNSHGESVVHLACRRGTLDMLQFLLDEAHVTIRIRDDKGRTPLHDACWTDTPNFKLVYLLLQVAPELLFVQDHRGHTPLAYVPRRRWGAWNAFLQKHRVFLRASVRSLRFDRAKYLVRSIVPCLK
jgi:hypothetical protein